MALSIIVTKELLQQMIDDADVTKKQHIIGRALVALYERQTQSEQCALHTLEDNGVGFAGGDAIGGSLTAKSYMARKGLQDWQVERWTRIGKSGFSRICKYAGQLNEIANIKAAEKAKQLQLGM